MTTGSRAPMKILFMAYSCAPDSGGEPSVGWHWSVGAASDGHIVHVVTRENNRAAIEPGLATLPDEVRARIHMHYHDLSRPLLVAKKRLPMFGVMTYYVLWQLSAVPLVRRVSREHRIDFAHHVTFCNDAVFSACALSPTPFIWGPMGGWSHSFPKEHRSILTARARVYEAIRRGMQVLFGVLDPLCWLTRRRAAIGVYYSREALTETAPLLRVPNAQTVRHVGIDDGAFVATPSSRRSGEPLRLVTVGRLVHWKGFDLALYALAQAREDGAGPITLDIVGTGDERPHLERLARKLNLQDVVRFHGRIARHQDVVALVRESHVFIQPTLRDGPPVAMMEAMASGVPVLAAAYGAVSELVPASAGCVVPRASGPRELAALLAGELRRLDADEDARSTLAAGAVTYARDALTWRAVATGRRALYDSMRARIAAAS